MTLVMDCCAVDALLEDDRFARYRSAIESGDLRLLWTHVTTDELAATTDPEHRATLLAVGAALCVWVPAGCFVLGFSRLGLAQMSEDAEALEAFRGGNIRHTRDAIICTTAELLGCGVLTAEKMKGNSLPKRALARGLQVLSPEQLDEKLAQAHP